MHQTNSIRRVAGLGIVMLTEPCADDDDDEDGNGATSGDGEERQQTTTSSSSRPMASVAALPPVRVLSKGSRGNSLSVEHYCTGMGVAVSTPAPTFEKSFEHPGRTTLISPPPLLPATTSSP